MTDSTKLTKRELEALYECSTHTPGTYAWRVKSMAKLVEKGLVKEVPNHRYGIKAWILTEAGKARLKLMESRE